MISIETFFILIATLLLLLMVVVLYRVVEGPTSIDRMIGVNMIGTKTTFILLVIGFVYERIDMFVDLAIAYALLNFIASVAAAKLIRRKTLADPWEEWEEVEATLPR